MTRAVPGRAGRRRQIADASLRALTLARDAGRGLRRGGLAAAVFGPADDLPGRGAGRLRALSGGLRDLSTRRTLAGYAPAAWARALAGLAERPAARDGRGGGGDRPGQRGAGPPRRDHRRCRWRPTASRVRPAGPGRWQLVRQRWAGSLLEDAELEATLALLTVAADAVPARLGTESGGAATVHVLRARYPGARTCGCARPNRPSAAAGCRWPPPGSWSAAAAASAARTGSRRWRSWPACSAARSGCRGW